MGDLGMLWLRRWKVRTSLEVNSWLSASPAGAHGFDPVREPKDPTCYLCSQKAEEKNDEREVLESTEFCSQVSFPSSLIQCWYPPQLHLQQTADVCFKAAFCFLLLKNLRNKVWFGSLTITRPSVWIRNHEPFFNSRRKPLPKGKRFSVSLTSKNCPSVKQSAPRKWLW